MTNSKYLLVYTALQRRLHWWVAALVAAQYAMQSWLVEAMEHVRSGQDVSFGDFLLTNSHMLIGVLVAYWVLVRLKLRRQMPKAEVSADTTNGERIFQIIALWVHRSMYAVLLGMVASGGLHYYADWSVAGQVHECGKWVLGGLVALHLVGALRHYYRLRRR